MPYLDPKSWVTNEIIGAADLNRDIRDNFRTLSRWATYTPTWAGSGSNPSVGNGTISGRFLQFEQWVMVEIMLVAGSTTTYGSGNYSFTLPVNGVSLPSGQDQTINGHLLDAGVSRYPCLGAITSGAGTAQVVQPANWGTPSAGNWTPTNPFTFGNGDSAFLRGIYRTV